MRVLRLHTLLYCLLLLGASAHSARLGGVLFNGSTIYDSEALLPSYQALLGSEVSDDLKAQINDALTEKYLDAGFFAPGIEIRSQDRIPQILDVYITEPSVGDLRVYGRRYIQEKSALRQIAALQRLAPLSRARYREALRRLSDATGLHVSGRLVAAHNDDDLHIGYVRIAPRMINTSLAVNNRGLERFGREIYSLGASWYGDDMDVRGQIAGSSDLSQFRREYLRVSGAHNDNALSLTLAHVQANIEAFDYRFDKSSVGINAARTLIDNADRWLSLAGGLNGYSSDRAIGSFAADEQVRSLDLLASLTERTDHLGTHRFALRLRSGIDGLGAGTDDPSVDLSFLSSRLDHRSFWRLPGETELLVILSAQWSQNQLPSSERFSYGGEYMGGAFDPGALSGDSGLSTRATFSRDLLRQRLIGDVAAYTYADYGRVWRNIDDFEADGAAAGIGLKFEQGRLSATLELAHMVDRPRAQSALGKTRGFFSLRLDI